MSELKEKQVRAWSGPKLAIGYCDLQNLLHYTSKTGYTYGVYGWNFDVYCVGDVTITTGYRRMIGRSVPYNLTKEYDDKAKEIVNSWDENLDYDTKKSKVNALLDEYIEKALAL